MTPELTNPPFMRQPGQPPLHLRDLTPAEVEQWRRMLANYTRLHKPSDSLESAGRLSETKDPA